MQKVAKRKLRSALVSAYKTLQLRRVQHLHVSRIQRWIRKRIVNRQRCAAAISIDGCWLRDANCTESFNTTWKLKMMCIFLRACSHSNTTKGAETSQIFNIVRENISYISALFRTRERKMFKIEESSSRKIAILFSK